MLFVHCRPAQRTPTICCYAASRPRVAALGAAEVANSHRRLCSAAGAPALHGRAGLYRPDWNESATRADTTAKSESGRRTEWFPPNFSWFPRCVSVRATSPVGRLPPAQGRQPTTAWWPMSVSLSCRRAAQPRHPLAIAAVEVKNWPGTDVPGQVQQGGFTSGRRGTRRRRAPFSGIAPENHRKFVLHCSSTGTHISRSGGHRHHKKSQASHAADAYGVECFFGLLAHGAPKHPQRGAAQGRPARRFRDARADDDGRCRTPERVAETPPSSPIPPPCAG
jgi:hypothetical protein